MPRLQFTLRSLLVAMLVVAAFFGGMAVGERRERDRRRARELRELEEYGQIGATVHLSYPQGHPDKSDVISETIIQIEPSDD